MGALVEWVLGEAQHYDLLLDLQPYLGVPGVLPVLPLLLLGLGFGLDLWGSSGDVFCPGPSVAVGWPSSSLCSDVQRSAAMCSDVQRCATMCSDVQRCAAMCSDV